jgi:uncharacterized protein
VKETFVVDVPTIRQRFLILHGWQNRRPVGHWQHWLAGQLAARGHDVAYPQLPAPDEPSLKDWLAAIERELADAGPGCVVLAHSLSCVAWIHLADQGSVHLPVSRLLLVAPPSPGYLAGVRELREFQFGAAAPRASACSSRRAPRLAYADNDPYCTPPAGAIYDGFDLDEVPGAGHLDMVAGYGRWLSALRWCEDPDTRLTAS